MYNLKIIHIFHPCYHSKIMGHTLKNRQKYKWGQVFNNGPRKICGRRSSKSLKCGRPYHFKAVFRKFYLVYSWILCAKCLCIYESASLITMKMKMIMKNRSRRYVINRPTSRNEHKCSKYKKSLTMMLICIKQHINNIWSSIHENVKKHWGWVEK